MPELPEVESVVAHLRGAAVGRLIRSVEVRRARICHPQKPARVRRMVAGRRIEAVDRRGKNILILLSGGNVLRIHLGMTGELYRAAAARELPAATRAVLNLDRGRIVFEDPRALGRITAHRTAEIQKLLSRLGPEPLSPDFTADALRAIARSLRQPVKTFLMDQTRVAGLGNIYAAEALHRARIHPQFPVGALPPARISALHDSIVAVLRDAVQSALAAYGRPGRRLEQEEFQPAVYGREGLPCTTCGAAVRRITQAGRSTYFCPSCQRRARTRTG